jgi:hypothetical protein
MANQTTQQPQIFYQPPQDPGEAPELGPIASLSGPPSGAPQVFANAPAMPRAADDPLLDQRNVVNRQLLGLQDKDARHWGFKGDPSRGLAPNHPGIIGKIGHVLSVAGNIAGDIFAPSTMELIPGTDLNRRVQEGGLTQRLAGLTQQDSENQARDATTAKTQLETAEEPGKTESVEGLDSANTRKANAEADKLLHPQPDPDRAKTITTDKGIMQWNPATSAYDIPAGHAAKEQAPQQQAFDGYIAQGLTPMQAFEKIREKPPSASEAGTWQLGEDKDGKPILWNSKTGATRDNATGIEKPGTHDKELAANAPVEGAMKYASDYVANGRFTGPGDEALQEKFFELAKPSTGFRMTQPQIDMLANSRNWMNSWGAHMRHMTSGTWFSPEQRQQIVDTMTQLHDAKLATQPHSGGAPAAGAAGGGATPTEGEIKVNGAGIKVKFSGGKWGPA